MQKVAHFSPDDAKRFYDRFGKKQDRQGFYEDEALDALIQHANFSAAQSVIELGCGTGRLAARLFADHLPLSARYAATDISETMVRLAKERLEPWADRSAVHLSSGKPDFSPYGDSFDRCVSTYVFDLLSPEEIAETLSAAHSSLRVGGLLCTAGLTYGTDVLSSTTSRLWNLVRRVKPSLVGGCRPLALSEFILQKQWRILHRAVVVSFTVPSEIIVAEAV